MNKRDIIRLIGFYLVLDGVGSIIYYQATAAPIEQFFRLVRAGIGIYLATR